MAKLTKAERDALPASAFVFPGSRRYPIHDKGHAHAAIKDSAGTKDEAAVRAAVKARYGWDLSVIDGDVIDLGFNPNQPRDSHGRWTDTGFHSSLTVVKSGSFGKNIPDYEPPKVKAKSGVRGKGRTTKTVKPKGADWVVGGKHYDEFGKAKAAAESLFNDLDANSSRPGTGGHVAMTSHVFPKQQTGAGKQRAAKAIAKQVLRDEPGLAYGRMLGSHRTPAKKDPIAEAVANLDHATVLDVQSYWDHSVSADDRESLATDLGLNPRMSKKSIRELRRAIKDKRTKETDRAEMKAELMKRAAIAKKVSNEAKSWTSNLADALEGKPKDADLAPIIGETLAAHPRLGPLAHVWDRLRLSGYNFRKKIREGEFTDELPRVVARNVASVLIMFLALHFGMDIPGLGGGG